MANLAGWRGENGEMASWLKAKTAQQSAAAKILYRYQLKAKSMKMAAMKISESEMKAGS
jgi:hypothetical protein